MKGLVNKLNHTRTVVSGINQLMSAKAVVWKSESEVHLYQALLTSDPARRKAIVSNFYLYARIEKKLSPKIAFLKVVDIETGLTIATCDKGKVSFD
tara:strand:+ start:21862 stop:22149 length:288 start_codon:yes stop_codon:yes gene_type:complete